MEYQNSQPPVRVRVVVVNWNRRELLARCLESLTAQTHPSYEVCVVDNGSNDGSADFVRSLTADYPVPLLLIENQENRGFCAANNQGFADARTEFLALLNNDAEADPGWLAALQDAITQNERIIQNERIGMAASKILVWEDPSRIDKCGHLIYLDGQNRGRGTGQRDEGQFDQVEEVLWPDGCAAMYRRAMLEDVGGFDEDFFAYADDAELGLRARQAGWGCLYTPHAVVRHRRGQSLGVASARRLTLIERNRILLAVKLFPLRLLWVNGAYLLARLAAGASAAVRNRGEIRHYQGTAGKLRAGMAFLKGWLTAIPLLPRMVTKRWALRAKRRLTPRELTALLKRHRISLKELSEHAN